MKQRNFLVLAMFALLWPFTAHSQASCTLSTPGNTLLNFGAYNFSGAPSDAIAQIQFVCVPDLLAGPTVGFTLSADAGDGSAGSFNPRQLSNGEGGFLQYNMYLDSSRSNVFGDGSAGTVQATGACAAVCQVPVYGRIFGGQIVPPGDYSDDILITLDF